MLNFFDMIGELFSTIWNFIEMFVDSLLTAISVIGTAVIFPVYISGIVPQILLTATLALISLAVVKFLIGR